MRTISEAKAAAAIEHESICAIFEIGETLNDQTYIVMPYYEGRTLKELIAEGPMDPSIPYAAVDTRDARHDPLLITVLVPEQGSGGAVTAEIQPRADATFAVRLRQGDRRATCRLSDQGTLPEFEIRLF